MKKIEDIVMLTSITTLNVLNASVKSKTLYVLTIALCGALIAKIIKKRRK